MRLNSKKAFTLIELMVVIAIIGILATAGITQYMSYQARSRDAVRVSDVPEAVTALTTYQSDNSTFPDSFNNDGCLSNWAGIPSESLKDYFGWGKAPIDPVAGTVSKPCGTARSFWYEPLTRNWVGKSSFVVTTNVETWQKANVDWSKLTWDEYSAYETAFNDYADPEKTSTDTKKRMDPNNSIYWQVQ